MTTPTSPKYRTDARACSCPGYWYRRTCKHYRAYREAVALVLAQDAVNKAFPPIPNKLSTIGEPVSHRLSRSVSTYYQGDPCGGCVPGPRALLSSFIGLVA